MVERIELNRARAERDLLLEAVDLRDPRRLAGEKLGGEIPERRDELRLDELDLTEEMRLARRDLLGERVAIPGRTALEDVRDEDVGARELDARQQLVEKLPGLADERHTLLILVETRRFADEHQVGVRAPGAEHDLRSTLSERTAGAARGLLSVRSKRCGALDCVHRVASLRRRADGHR